jgi:uncharacterized protein
MKAHGGSGTTADAGLREKVAFLSDPANHAGENGRVQVVETHMAFVFLTDRFAWKMKKPVRYPPMDFSTLEARRVDCLEELRLNRRLAPGVYLDVVPLVRIRDGSVSLGGEGDPVEWLVHMKRLPRIRMLDRVLRDDQPGEARLRPAAELLAGFYRDAPTVLPPEEPPRNYFRREVGTLSDQLLRADLEMPAPLVERIAFGLLSFLEVRGEILDRRGEDGRFVEGHGDLRAEHVYLGPPPAVIDCLEFDRRLRILDPVDDLGFLWLDCERLGRPRVGAFFLEVYRRTTGDHPPPALLRFYRSYRAFLRARIAIWHLLDEDPGDAARWRGQAETYLDLALGHLPPS